VRARASICERDGSGWPPKIAARRRRAATMPAACRGLVDVVERNQPTPLLDRTIAAPLPCA